MKLENKNDDVSEDRQEKERKQNELENFQTNAEIAIKIESAVFDERMEIGTTAEWFIILVSCTKRLYIDLHI